MTEDASAHTRKYEHDVLGRNTRVVDSSDGTTHYCYDAACDATSQRNEIGQLVETVSPRGIRTRYEFEADTVHSPSAEAAGLFPEVNRGFLKAIRRTIPSTISGQAANEEFVTSYSYNDRNLLARTDYPESAGEPFGVSYGYDAAGNLDALRDANAGASDPHRTFWQLTEVEQGLRPTVEEAGDGTTTTRGYEARLTRVDNFRRVCARTCADRTRVFGFDCAENKSVGIFSQSVMAVAFYRTRWAATPPSRFLQLLK